MTANVHLYAYAATDADESDPTALFDTTTTTPDGVLSKYFTDATYEFLHEDEGAWVFNVYENEQHVASLYSEDVTPIKKAPAKKAPAKNAIPAGRLSTREVAEELDVAPSRLRVFLRSQGDRYTPPGSGGRYSFTKTDVKSIKTAFAKWEKELAAEKKAK